MLLRQLKLWLSIKFKLEHDIFPVICFADWLLRVANCHGVCVLKLRQTQIELSSHGCMSIYSNRTVWSCEFYTFFRPVGGRKQRWNLRLGRDRMEHRWRFPPDGRHQPVRRHQDLHRLPAFGSCRQRLDKNSAPFHCFLPFLLQWCRCKHGYFVSWLPQVAWSTCRASFPSSTAWTWERTACQREDWRRLQIAWESRWPALAWRYRNFAQDHKQMLWHSDA